MITRRDFRWVNTDTLKADMKKAPWRNIYSVGDNDIDNKVTILENIFSGIINKHAPMRTFRVTHPAAPWMNDKIKCLRDKRDIYENKYNKDKNPVTYDIYTQ